MKRIFELERFSGKGERARLGRSEPRPRGSHERVTQPGRLMFLHTLVFGARRAEQQPRRLRSPKSNFIALAKGLCLFGFTFAFTVSAALSPTKLRCEYAVNPLNVDVTSPRLFWIDESSGRGEHQTAYEILVASSEKNLATDKGDLWDSGKISSDETIQIPYAGKALNSLQPVFWKVRAWDGGDKPSAWSKPAQWTMGLLHPADWQAKWIGASDTNIPSILLRREFAVKSKPLRALAMVCGLGEYELTVNGRKVGDDFLSPGWTEYDRTCLYDVRDVTESLRPGNNAIGLELGNGMYNVIGPATRFSKFRRSFGPQKAIVQIRLEYADGSVEIIGTDERWKVSSGPITFSSIYGGEDFDGRLAQVGWNKPGFDDSKWAKATILGTAGAELRGISGAAPAIREFEFHIPNPPQGQTLSNGDVVFDLGQNAAHVPRITVAGPPGSTVRLMPSELLDAQGAVNQGSMGGGRRGAIWCDFTKATSQYSDETWSPKFFYVGCRYVQAHLTGGARIVALDGAVIQSSSEPAGEFECSNPLFNRIRQLVRWAQRSNMESVMTDCPHRERLGWLEQDHLNGPSLRYEFDLAQLFTKTVNDIADSQLENGLVPTTAPEYAIFRDKADTNHLRNSFGDSLEWSSTFTMVPWQQYEFDGDLNLFRIHYDAMKEYLAYIGTRATNYIVSYGLGDWYDLGPNKPGVSQLTPVALTATAFYFQNAKIMAQAAALLGKTDDAARYSELAKNVATAFNEKFYNPTNHFYATDSQCANAIPLVMGICEPQNRAAVVEAIVQDVRSRGNALTAGDVGYRYLLRALADGGRSDVIFEINNQTNKPGYGMQVAKGKTSLTEAWDGGSSQDHFMLGQIEEWFYHDLAGIQNAPGSAGFKAVVIDPQPVGDITWAKASYDSIRGKIVSDWKRDGTEFTLKTTIPPNATATVFVPAKSADAVRENGKPAQQNAGVKFLRFENGRAVFAIESGSYEFKSQL